MESEKFLDFHAALPESDQLSFESLNRVRIDWIGLENQRLPDWIANLQDWLENGSGSGFH